MLTFDNINEAQLFLIKSILSDGHEVKTRGYLTKEIFPVMFAIENPYKRITTLKARKWNFAAALGELSWHFAKSNDVDFIASYLSNWRKFSEDNEHITGSCYGFKIFKKDDKGISKWNNVINILNSDPGSRRAVINLIDDSEQINTDKPDISCTISFQFLIRNNKLDIIVNMRSNDIIWGLPYDFFLFSYFQELMAVELGIPLGRYFHIAGSMHIYERHFKLGQEIITTKEEYLDLEMPQILNNQVEIFTALERKIRMENIALEEIKEIEIDQYWKTLLEVLYYHKSLKKNEKILDIKYIEKNNYFSKIL